MKEVEYLKYMSDFAECMGLANPFTKIYIYPKYEMFCISYALAFVTIDHLKNVYFSSKTGIFLKKKSVS